MEPSRAYPSSSLSRTASWSRRCAKLLDRVRLKYYWLRAQNELRTKPSTSEHRLDLEG